MHLRPAATDKSFFEKLLFVGWREADDAAGYGTILALSFRSEAFYHEETGDDKAEKQGERGQATGLAVGRQVRILVYAGEANHAIASLGQSLPP